MHDGSGDDGATVPDVLDLQEIDRTDVAIAGGKGAQLGALSRLAGVRVPAGFCVTTAAFARALAAAPSLGDRLDRLGRLGVADREALAAVAADLRRTLEDTVLADDLAAAITGAVARPGEDAAWAVRSSATAEDSPGASFAGQHDTWLGVVGAPAVLEHVRRCWASLFTDRAVAYRAGRGLDPRAARMAVVVQRMVAAAAAGVVFTADPVTGNRRVVAVEATSGLGEALVSGEVNGDAYRVRDGVIVSRTERQPRRALTDAQVVRLAKLGRRIEAHFGRPQDIEWCRVGDVFHVVQSRPITALFPIPEAGDQENRVYVSVGHQQMMTDAMKPLGLSVWRHTSPAPMREAGGRLFVEVTEALASPARRAGLLAVMGKGDPLVADALQTIVDRGDFVREVPDAAPGPAPFGGAAPLLEADPALVEELVALAEAALAELEREIRTRSGAALIDFVVADVQGMRRILFEPRTQQVIRAAMEATWWLGEHLEAWLGEKHVADVLTWSAPHNVTSEMGLALLEVADVIRPHPAVVAFLADAPGGDFLDDLGDLEGGPAARAAIEAFLDRYGMRCAGEIDVTRPRWREQPSALVPLILGNVARFEPGEAARRFERGRAEAERKAEEVLARLRTLPDGEAKAEEAARMIDRVRAFIGYREYPKYAMVSRYFVYKRALLEEAARLAEAGVLRAQDDVFFLTLEELQAVVRTGRADAGAIRQRRAAFDAYTLLRAPRVLTSEGEGLNGTWRREDVPAGALEGLAVSAGTVEGRARVVLDLAAADLEAGDILVTTCTDPSWTPLMLTAAGLVTEVGGLMTHGAVIAREYGVPAVVGVPDATGCIRDGQRIRVHGTEGWVELLPEADPAPR